MIGARGSDLQFEQSTIDSLLSPDSQHSPHPYSPYIVINTEAEGFGLLLLRIVMLSNNPTDVAWGNFVYLW